MQRLPDAAWAPAAATTLLLALGVLPPTGRTAALLTAVGLLAVLGEGLRRVRSGPRPPAPSRASPAKPDAAKPPG